MNSSCQLDLVGVGWPICLLEYQQRLMHLSPGDVLEVQVEDPEVAATIRQLAWGQRDRIIDEHHEGRFLRLAVQKHAPVEQDSESTGKESL